MKIIETSLQGVLVIEPRVFPDARGFFVETYQRQRYQSMGLVCEFVQDNLSFSSRGVLRGLHFQNPHEQGKLVQVLQGEVWDVAVDIRRNSPQFGRWAAVTLSSVTKNQFYVPPGFAHGFCVLSDTALFAYKCTDIYYPANEVGFRWDDPDVGIAWPVREPILSEKDGRLPLLRDIPAEQLPEYRL
jgi:dTDP-4-dehydrorhamnose 3,5-epimerase